MTRVSSMMIANSALNNIQKTQFDLYEAQRKTASENQADDMKGYGSQTQTLVSTQRLLAKSQSYLDTGKEIATRLSLQDTALERAADAIVNLREDLTEGLSLNSGAQFSRFVDDAFAAIKDSFNTQMNGRYLFGGTINDQPPITSASITDLGLNPLANAFTPDGQPQSVRIEDHKTIQAGPVASDAANEIMGILKRLEEFNTGPNGPFAEPLTDAQRNAVMTELANLTTAYDNMLDVQAANGRNQSSVAAAVERQQMQYDTMSFLVSDISSVDLAEVAAELNQAQLQFQATASVFNTIRSLSLLDYLG